MEPLRRPVAGRHAGSRPEHNGPLSCLPRPGRPQPQPGQLCHQPACVPKCGGGFCHPPRLWGAHFACGVAPAAMETSTPTRWAGLEPLSGGQRFLQLPPARSNVGLVCRGGAVPTAGSSTHVLEGRGGAASGDPCAARGPVPPSASARGSSAGGYSRESPPPPGEGRLAQLMAPRPDTSRAQRHLRVHGARPQLAEAACDDHGAEGTPPPAMRLVPRGQRRLTPVHAARPLLGHLVPRSGMRSWVPQRTAGHSRT